MNSLQGIACTEPGAYARLMMGSCICKPCDEGLPMSEGPMQPRLASSRLRSVTDHILCETLTGGHSVMS